MRLVILSRQPSLYSTRALFEAALNRGHDVQVMDTLQFDIRLSRRSPELYYQGEPVGPVDAVIPRIGASITFFGLAVVRQFEMMGVYCLNESQAIARSRDKLRSLQLLSRHDIGLPPTVYTRQAEHIPSCIEKVEGPPVVVSNSSGMREQRPLVETTLRLGPVTKRVRLTITNRAGMRFPMLLGREALAGCFLVDVSPKYLLKG